MTYYSKEYDPVTNLQRVSLVLGELSRELQYATANAASPIHPATPAQLRGRPAEQAPQILLEAQRVSDMRQRWVRTFGDNRDLLHDPALDILLYLFIAARRHDEVSVSSACYAANVPQTTGLRYIGKLQVRGLLLRSDDPFDGRRHLLELTEAGEELICRCLVKS